MAYDSGRDVVVLYGGASGWPYSSQTWEFDLSSATWSVVNDGTAQAPNAVHGMSLTYDPDNQRMLLFGGSDNQDQELNELWSFANGGWDNDPNSVGWLVVYGGNERGTVLNDLWAFDGTGWDFANVTPNTPAGRTDQSMIYRENGAASKYEFVIYGERLEMVDGMGHTKIYTPTASGQLAQEEDENGKITNYSYNSFDQVTQIQYAFGTADQTAVSYLYDSLGRLIETTNQDGTVRKTEYDAANRVTKTTNNYLAGQPQNHQDRYNLITTYTYDSAGRLTSTTDTFGKTDLTEYDSAGRPFKRIMNYDGTTPTGQLCTSAWFNNPDPENNICSLTGYDQYGRVSSTTDALGHVSRTFYDDLGRVLGTVNHSVQITDKSQLDSCFTLPTDRDSDVCSKNEYDAMGNLIIS
ncbi:MAG: kelch repeat-containing protein, partial [Chloroflexota bacterium]